jgi:2'-5' RNA ligase
MPYAVELLLREDDSGVFDDFWTWMSDHRYGTMMDGRPHITLAVWDTLDLDVVAAWLATLAGTTAPLSVQFVSIGIFPNYPCVLFLGPIVTGALTAVQAHVIANLPAEPGSLWGNYRPGRWVPHCTLGMGLDLEECMAATRQAKEIDLPIDATLDRLAVVEIPMTRNHLTVDLAG